ncbi:MAG: type II toxin-antitoxin system Phd/YefM family antitoxin [Nitrospirae bacterium]|nr:type II toxin-antitoxin system Phd/YefM family antitoxin [Nitrospirota bacterium]
MVKTLNEQQAKSGFTALVGRVHSKKDTIIVEKQGKPMVAMIDFDRYQALVKKREKLFAVLDRIWARNRTQPARQAYRDASQAVTEFRATRRAHRRVGA